MEKITTCQICGRVIKSKNGLIAHHGYQRPGGGWQTASCFGARFRPYEVACDAIQPCIDGLQRYIDKEMEALESLIKNPPEALFKMRLGWKKPIRYELPEGFEPKDKPSYLPNSYEDEHRSQRGEHRRNINGAKLMVKDLTERLANWKQKEAA